MGGFNPLQGMPLDLASADILRDPSAGIGFPSMGAGAQEGFLSKARGLLTDPLFRQLLGAAGVDISTGSGGKNVLAAMQQNIAARNYSKLLSSILGGEIPGAKMAVGADGIKLNIPGEAARGEGVGITGAGATVGATAGGAAGGAPGGAQGIDLSQLLGNLNPFASSQLDFSSADLAGIDPQLLTQALQLKLGGAQLGQRKISDLADMMYQQGLLRYYERTGDIAETGAATARINAITNMYRAVKPEALDQPFPITGAGGEELTVREWNALPQSEQEYAIYVDSVEEGETALSRHEFQLLDPTDRERFLRRALDDPKLMKGAKELAEATRPITTVQISPFEQTRQREEAQAQADVMAPDFISKIESRLAEDWYWKRVTPEVSRAAKELKVPEEEAIGIVQKRKVLAEIERQIRQAFKGSAVSRKLDGWYVDGVLKVRNPYAGR